MRAGKNRCNSIPLIWIFVGGIGQSTSQRGFVALVKSKNQQTVVLLGPLVVAGNVLFQPLVANTNGGRNWTVVHVMDKVRNHKGDRRQRTVIGRKVCRESQVRGISGCLAVRHVGEANPGNVLTRIET